MVTTSPSMSEPSRAGIDLPAESMSRTDSALSVVSFRPFEKWICSRARGSMSVALSRGLTCTTFVDLGGSAANPGDRSNRKPRQMRVMSAFCPSHPAAASEKSGLLDIGVRRLVAALGFLDALVTLQPEASARYAPSLTLRVGTRESQIPKAATSRRTPISEIPTPGAG